MNEEARQSTGTRPIDGFDAQPVLTSDTAVLRPLVPADFEALCAVASDPLIWALHPAHDRWRAPVFRRFFDEAMASGGALAAIDPGSGAIIGSSRYDFERADPGEVEIGWTFLARAYWGGAVNAAMKRLMVARALASFGQAIFLVGEHNLRSRRALEKIGALLTSRTQMADMAGVEVRHVIYAIDRARFEAGPLAR